MHDTIYYGATLYPELWNFEIVKKDIERMKKIGMNTARIGEFAWSTFEPQENIFNFDILEQTIRELEKQDMHVIVCTSTVAPPIWLTHDHEERLHHTADGKTYIHGSRQHVCTNNAYFRERASIFTEKFGQELKKYSNVIAIQLDNEFKSHVGPCYCDSCKKEWHRWLEDKYQAISCLNKKWNTKIWSQEYQSFDQVVQPKVTAFMHNISLVEAYREFTHDKIVEFAEEQASILRKHVSIPITHNTSFAFDLDNEKLFGNLDFVGFDTYVDKPVAFLMNSAYWPFIKSNNQKYMLLETSTSNPGHVGEYRKLHPKGFVEGESFVTFASEGIGFLFWLFRQQEGGVEQPHGSVISAWGDETIGYFPSENIGKLKTKIEPLLKNSTQQYPQVAVTYSDRAKSFINTENGGIYNYRDLLTNYYELFVDNGIYASLYPEEYSLNNVSILFTPFVHYLSKSFLEKVMNFVNEGGTWIVGPMSGDRTENHRWFTDNGLGELGKILNLKKVIQFPAIDGSVKGLFLNEEVQLDMLSTLFECGEGLISLGEVKDKRIDGDYSFLAEKEVGKGKLVLVGSQAKTPSGEDITSKIIKRYVDELNILDKEVKTQSGVIDIIRESKTDGEQHWLINFSNQMSQFTLAKEKVDVLSGEKFEAGSYEIDPYKYYIFIDK